MNLSFNKVLRNVAAGVVAVVSCISLAACGGNNQQENSAGKNTTITVFNGATGTISKNFNPFSPTALQPTLGIIYEPLYYYNLAKASKPKSMLATAYSWNQEGTELTITTRDKVKWSDGQPFTAKDVAYTFNLIHNTPSLNTSGLAATAKATDDNHAVLTFSEKDSFIQEAQVLGNQAIVPEHVWKNVKDPVTYINASPIGTGAFKLQKFTSQSYSLVSNNNYWGGKPKIRQVRYISLNDADGATSALLAGKVDWMSAFIPKLQNIVKNNPEITYINTPALTTVAVTCSETSLGCSGPQTDGAVRKAMYYAMDRSQLNKLAGSGYGEIASPTMLRYKAQGKWIADKANLQTPQSADISKATSILENAGWVKGPDGVRAKDGQRLSMTIQTVSGWSDYISINDTLRQEFKKVGIELKTSQMSWNEWNDNEQKGNFQLSLDSFGLGASDDPYFTYNPKYYSKNTARVGQTASGGNFARYSNSIVDSAIRAASTTNDSSKKVEQYGIIQKQIVEDMPYIPIYVNSMLTEFSTANVKGWPTKDNLYALPAAWKAWDDGIILQRIQPK